MASYRLVFKPSVEKDMRYLAFTIVARIIRRIEALQNEPFPRGAIKLTSAEGLYRIRVGDYRVIYGVDVEAKCVTIHYVRHRRDVYRGL